MRRNASVAIRYVRALSALYNNTEEARKILTELKVFWDVLTKEKTLRDFFLNPVISKKDKRDAINELKDRLTLTNRFLTTLIDMNRVSSLPDIIEEFEAELEAQSGELGVSLEVARPWKDSVVEDVRSYLQEKWKRNIRMKTTVKPELLGGFIARAPGKILDASVNYQLENLKQSLLS